MTSFPLELAWPRALGGRLSPAYDWMWTIVWQGIAREDLDLKAGARLDRTMEIGHILTQMEIGGGIRAHRKIQTSPADLYGAWTIVLAIEVLPVPDPVRGMASTADEYIPVEFPFEMLTSDFLNVWEVMSS